MAGEVPLWQSIDLSFGLTVQGGVSRQFRAQLPLKLDIS
jgi:hypothetical protein